MWESQQDTDRESDRERVGVLMRFLSCNRCKPEKTQKAFQNLRMKKRCRTQRRHQRRRQFRKDEINEIWQVLAIRADAGVNVLSTKTHDLHGRIDLSWTASCTSPRRNKMVTFLLLWTRLTRRIPENGHTVWTLFTPDLPIERYDIF